MEYSQYTVKDFLMDEYFQRWVLNPDEETDNFWQSWLALHPDKEEIIEEARDILLNFHFRKYEFTPENFTEVWKKIQAENERFNRQKQDHLIPKVKDIASGPAYHYRKIAAAIAVLMLFAAGFYFYGLNFDSPVSSYTTSYGETRTITLPDSSEIALNANSSLKIKQNWNQEGEAREIWVDGEAFFTIKPKKDDRKFIVHTDNLSIEVLGTRFNVNTRRDKTEVVLNEGEVKLNSQLLPDREPLYMQPGELVSFSKKDKSIKQKMVDPENYSAWRNNKLVFKDKPIKEITGELEDNFGIEIVFEDTSLTSHRFTGTIPMDQYEIFFTTIAKTFDVSISREGNQVIITKSKNEDS